MPEAAENRRSAVGVYNSPKWDLKSRGKVEQFDMKYYPTHKRQRDKYLDVI